jgi:hypothetical protein
MKRIKRWDHTFKGVELRDPRNRVITQLPFQHTPSNANWDFRQYFDHADKAIYAAPSWDVANAASNQKTKEYLAKEQLLHKGK